METIVKDIINSIPEYQHMCQSFEQMYDSVRHVLDNIDIKIEKMNAIGILIDDKFWNTPNSFYDRHKCIHAGSEALTKKLMNKLPDIDMVKIFDIHTLFLRQFICKFTKEFPDKKAVDVIPLSVLVFGESSFAIGLRIEFKTPLIDTHQEHIKIKIDDKYMLAIHQFCIMFIPFKQDKFNHINQNKIL